MCEPIRAVVFDFDGVLLQSVDIKTRAFEALFAPEGPEAARRIVDYHRANGGISRFEKFRWAYRKVLRRPLDAGEERALGERFNRLVEREVLRAPWMPGASEFLESLHADLPLFIASGTPEDELRRIVERREMTRYFRGIYGTPETKGRILVRIARESGCGARSLVMVGDAGNDLDAASAAGTRFVGILAGGAASPFPASTQTLPDLTGLAALLGLATG